MKLNIATSLTYRLHNETGTRRYCPAGGSRKIRRQAIVVVQLLHNRSSSVSHLLTSCLTTQLQPFRKAEAWSQVQHPTFRKSVRESVGSITTTSLTKINQQNTPHITIAQQTHSPQVHCNRQLYFKMCTFFVSCATTKKIDVA